MTVTAASAVSLELLDTLQGIYRNKCSGAQKLVVLTPHAAMGEFVPSLELCTPETSLRRRHG